MPAIFLPGDQQVKCSILVATFPYGNKVDNRLGDWVAWHLIPSILKDKDRIGSASRWGKSDTPITMLRNRCIKVAEENKIDFVLMLDSDNIPDWYLPGAANFWGVEPDMLADPFWESSFDFAWNHRMEGKGPCVVMAPYCGPGPNEVVFSFDWVNRTSGHAEPDFALELVPRHDAAQRTGIRRAAAGATGVMLIDMLAIKRLREYKAKNKLRKSLFYYEWKDDDETEKASTEDVAFTRDLSIAGIPLYCNWNAWAGHEKSRVVGKPWNFMPEAIPALLRSRDETDAVEPRVDEGHRGSILSPTSVRSDNTYKNLPEGFPLEIVRQGPSVKIEDGPVDTGFNLNGDK